MAQTPHRWLAASRRSISCAALVLATTLPSVAASAQAGVPADVPENPNENVINDVIAALDSPDYRVRTRATDLLAAADTVSFDQIADYLAAPDLTPEREQRLLRALERRYFAMPAPALGVRNGNAIGDGTIVLAGTVEPFDAAVKLQAGDIVLEADGRPIADWNQLIIHIMSYLPGEAMPITVSRGQADGGDRDIIDVEVIIGSYDRLDQPQGPIVEHRLEGMRVRLERMGLIDNPRPMGAALAANDWLKAEGIWPLPARETPIGETGLRPGKRSSPSRYFEPSGQSKWAVRSSTLTRPDVSARERVATRGIGLRSGMPGWWEVMQAYRIGVQQLAELDARYLNSADDSSPTRSTQALKMQRDRADKIAELELYAQNIESDGGAQPLPTAGSKANANTDPLKTPNDTSDSGVIE